MFIKAGRDRSRSGLSCTAAWSTRLSLHARLSSHTVCVKVPTVLQQKGEGGEGGEGRGGEGDWCHISLDFWLS